MNSSLIELKAYLPALNSFSPLLAKLPLMMTAFLVTFAGTAFFYLVIKLVLIRSELNRPYSILELKPLRQTEQTPIATKELFNVLHSISGQRPYLKRIFSLNSSFSLEIVSAKKEGIRYLIRVEKELAGLFKKSLMSYLPGIKVTHAAEYLIPTNLPLLVTEFGLAKHFAYPLRAHESLDNNDPIAYLTGNMTKLRKEEMVAFQLVASPLNKEINREVKKISSLIYSGKDLVSNLNRKRSAGLFSFIAKVLLQLALLPIGLIVFVLTGGKEGPLIHTMDTKSSNPSNPYQKELEETVKEKLDQPLFKASLRVLVSGDNLSSVKTRSKGFASALTSMSTTGFQALKPKKNLRIALLSKLFNKLFYHRLLSPLSKNIFSSSEISDLYHFPFTKTTKTEDLQKEFSKELPTPVSLKNTKNLESVFAKNTYGGTTTPIGLTLEERRRHVYILGATGTGKSTLLLSMIKNDLEKHKGLCLIDPHGDLTEQVLSLIPENRVSEVIYFNPDDIGFPMGINLLELTPGLSDEDKVREKEFIAESIISVFHKIYTEKYSGPRMEYILRNTIHTAFTVPDATLFTVYKLLINAPFRKSVVRNLTDENLKDFWKYEFAKAGDYQKVKMISPITNKIGRFLFSPTAKRILEQPRSTINFDAVLNQGKIMLCNLSKGKIGEDNSSVFGVLIMAKIQLASFKRARMKESQRKDFYLYVDEFQNFATPAFAQILSEARKYRLNAILAHQTTSQLKKNSLVNVTLANTGTVICFKTANPEDERVILPQFYPSVQKGEILSLPSYRFYMRLGALNPEEPFSGTTVPVTAQLNMSRVGKVIASSRKLYAKKYSEVMPSKVADLKTVSQRPVNKAVNFSP